MADQNTEDVRNITEGDRVTVETDEEQTFDLTCDTVETRQAQDPDAVRETRTWTFYDQRGRKMILQITDGLRRFEWQEEFPHHRPLFDESVEEGVGYITNVQIHGVEV